MQNAVERQWQMQRQSTRKRGAEGDAEGFTEWCEPLTGAKSLGFCHLVIARQRQCFSRRQWKHKARVVSWPRMQ